MAISQAYKDRILREHREYRADEDLIHNRVLHRRIKAAWKEESPEFHAALQKAGILNQTAYVVQERMWREKDRLIKAGYPVTDAREQAERTQLMLGPDRVEPGVGEVESARRMGYTLE